MKFLQFRRCEASRDYSSKAATIWREVFEWKQDLQMDDRLKSGNIFVCDERRSSRSSTSKNNDNIEAVKKNDSR